MSTDTVQLENIVFSPIQEEPPDLSGAIVELQSKLLHLRAIITAQDEKITALESWRADVVENLIDAYRRINALEYAKDEPGKKELSLIDELYTHMKEVGLKQTTFSGAAKILGVTRGRVHQLKAIIALDQRFIVLPSETHKRKLLIRIKSV